MKKPLLLMFHSVSRPRGSIRIPPDTFAAQMDELAASGRRVVSLREIVASLGSGEPLGDAVALTFDDGYVDLLAEAAPLLAREGWPATVFVCADLLGGSADWEDQPDMPPLLLGVDQLVTLGEQGIEVGSHSRTHPDLRGLPADRLEDEIAGSRALLEERLQVAVEFFAMPYGRFDEAARHGIRRNYTAAVGTRLAALDAGADLFDLPRIEMFYFCDRRRWRRLLAGGGGVDLGLRRWVRATRTRVAGQARRVRK